MAADHNAAISSYLAQSGQQMHHSHSPQTPSGHISNTPQLTTGRVSAPQHAVDNTPANHNAHNAHRDDMLSSTPNAQPHSLVVQQLHDQHVNAYASGAVSALLHHHHTHGHSNRPSQGTPQSVSSHHSSSPSSASHIKSESLSWSAQPTSSAGGSNAPDEEDERQSQYDAAAAVAAAVAAQRESVEAAHHMSVADAVSGAYGSGLLDASVGGVTDAAQQAAAQAAAALYGHVSLHHGGAAAAHYLSQAAMSAATRGQLAAAAYSHPVGGSIGGGEMRGNYGMSHDIMSPQKAVAFLAGPRERIHVFGNPVECCPRCQQEGFGNVHWRPHRHIGELKIRYICERNFEELESNHHLDIPLCPVCGQVLYLYEFNGMLGVSSARRLHKYVLKCASQHVLPIIDLFCQTKRGGERCNSNFKLQWSYGTMVKRCESQKNRDHDLWWVRYKNEWKQRRTIIRYKKDFLRHLSDVQRALLLGLGLEGEAPPDPKTALGPTYDALVASAGGSPTGPKIRKRHTERGGPMSSHDDLDFGDAVCVKRQHRESPMDVNSQVSAAAYLSAAHGGGSPLPSSSVGQNTTSAATLAYQTLLAMGGVHGGSADPGHLNAIHMSYAKQFATHGLQGTDPHTDLVGRHSYAVDT